MIEYIKGYVQEIKLFYEDRGLKWTVVVIVFGPAIYLLDKVVDKWEI